MKILTSRWRPDEWLRGDAADLIAVLGRGAEPQMLIDRRALEVLFFRPDWFAPALTIIRPAEGHGSGGHCVGEYEECDNVKAGSVCFVNKMLRLQTDERTLIWRILRYHPDDCQTWEMVWPD